MIRTFALAIMASLTFRLGTAIAIPPPYVSDEELAHMPIIVEAQWNRAAFTAHDDDLGDFKHSVGRTTLTVTRVVKGDVKPGELTLYMGYRIGWEQTGGTPYSYMSTMMGGDVEDVCQPNLWCLEWEKSRHTTTGESYLSLTTYRGVQPLPLEPYFRALNQDDPEGAIKDLLRAGITPVCMRCLEFVNGGTPPAPYWGEFDEWFRGAPDRSRVRKSLAPNVKTLMQHENAEVRRMAIATYGSILEATACGDIRARLTDTDDGARAIAICLLATHRDTPSINAINEAAAAIHDGQLGSAAVDRLAEWGDVRLVPALIWFLDETDYSGRRGDDLYIPALRAQAALKRITGFVFPLDAKRSGKAWNDALKIVDEKRRIDRLSNLLPDELSPLRAEAIGTVDHCEIRVSNVDRRTWTVTTMPADLDISTPTSLEGRSKRATVREHFVDLAPGKSIRFSAKLPERFILAEPQTRQFRLFYYYNGRKLGLQAWVGKLDVSFGNGWSEPVRNVVDGDEFWPNGN